MRRVAVSLALGPVAALLAGCGGSQPPARSTSPPRVPQTLGRSWAARADAIANAAGAGRGCRAEQLAASLRDDVISAQRRIPAALRATLLTTVNQLADRITCPPPTRTVTAPAEPPHPPHHEAPKPPKPPKPDKHPHH
jgi:hypothetical protein